MNMTGAHKGAVAIGVGLMAFFILAAGAWGVVPALLFGLPWVLIARRGGSGAPAGGNASEQPYSDFTSPSRDWQPQNVNNTIMSPSYRHLPQNIFHRR